MCTSHVAGNTQMASLDRQVTQNGLGVNNTMARGIYNGGIPRYQDDMEVTVCGMMSGGVLDVDTKMMQTHP